MPEAAEKFDTAMSVWKEWQGAPWGRLRYAIAEANLVPHFGAEGTAAAPLRLAARGTTSRSSTAPAMLTAARAGWCGPG
ncbi:hypothetical protein [Streptomyces sp. NPDC060035]|uniref:hypothetical protein n=1 Tax=Streptomyces sp. NPDC060035 TaxID=3347044 RepID=UPI0036A1D903